MSILESIENILFPYDFSKINSRGLFMSAASYSTYRMAMAIIATLMQAFLILYGPDLANYTYLTYWGFTATFFYFILAGFENILQKAYGRQLNLKTWKVIHFVFPDIVCLQLMINGIYWFVFFPFIVIDNTGLSWLDILQAIGAHFFPMLLLSVELFSNLVCYWNYKRIITIVFIMALYLVVNVLYTLNVDIVYSVLRYDDWLTYVFILGSIVGTVVCCVILRLFSRFYKEKKVLELLGVSLKETSEVNQENPMPTNHMNETPTTFLPKINFLPKHPANDKDSTSFRNDPEYIENGHVREEKTMKEQELFFKY